MTIGSNIKKLRTTKKMTQEQLAERLHVTRQTVSSWEIGKSRPDFDLLEAIAEALDTNVMVLLYGPEPNVPLSKKRILVPVVCTVTLVALCMIMKVWLRPEIKNISRTFDAWPRHFYNLCFFPFCILMATVLLCSLAGLRWDISLPPRQRRVCLVIALALAALYFMLLLPVFLSMNAIMPSAIMIYPFTVLSVLVGGTLGILTAIACGILGYLACNPSRKLHPPNGNLQNNK